MKRSLKITIVSILCVVMAGLLLASVFFLVFINHKLETPNNLKILELESDKVVLETDVNENCKSYLFYIKEQGGEFVEHSSQSPVFDASEVLEREKSYTIKVMFKAEVEYANSNFSKDVEFTYYNRLKTPVLFLNQNDEYLFWNNVYGAESYEINLRSESGQVIKENVVAKEGINNFSLTALGGGDYIFSVKACSTNENTKESFISNQIIFSFTSAFQTPNFISFDKANKKLVLSSHALIKSFNIYLYENQFTFIEGPKMKIENLINYYAYEFDLSDIYNGESTEIRYQAVGQGNNTNSSIGRYSII